MGKRRKQKVPYHAGLAKRQQLSWNLSDRVGEPSTFCVNDGTNNSSPHLEQSDTPMDQTESAENMDNTSQTPGGAMCVDRSQTCQVSVDALCVEAFYQNLASCHTTLTLHSHDSPKLPNTDVMFEFGKFTVSLLEEPRLTPLPNQLPEFTECWLYLSAGDSPSMLYFEAEECRQVVSTPRRPKSRQSKFGVFWFVKLNVPVKVLSSVKTKHFQVSHFLYLN